MQMTDALREVTVGAPLEWRNVQVFPLTQPNGHAPQYALLDELLDQGKVEVTELHEGGSVPTIKVRNHADVEALILDGTELRGAKQNRMVNVTIIVGQHGEAEIPVSCVERGRWSYRSRHFASSKRTVASKLRNLKGHMVNERLARSGRPSTDQAAVWDRVDAYMDAAAVASPTSAMDDVFAQREAAIDEFISRLKDIDACGAAVVINGEIIAVDIVDHRDTFKRLWEMLLRGYAMDATIEPKRSKLLTDEDVKIWLRGVADQATLTPHPVGGVGQYYAVRAPRISGGCTIHRGRVVHTALFPSEGWG